MKRIAVLLICILIVQMLSACGDNYPDTLAAGQATAAETIDRNTAQLHGEVAALTSTLETEEDAADAAIRAGDNIVQTEQADTAVGMDLEPASDSAAIGMTGYPGGEIQRSFLYYRGILYVYNYSWRRNISTIYREETAVESVDSYSIPTVELTATHLAVGDRIFVLKSGETDSIYVFRVAEDVFEEFVPYFGLK